MSIQCDYGSRTCEGNPVGVAIMHAEGTNTVIEARPICHYHSQFIGAESGNRIQFVRFTKLDN